MLSLAVKLRPPGVIVPLEDRTARLTILIDPRKKEIFERLCAEEDATPSQVVRRLIRGYIEHRTGQPWDPAQGASPSAAHVAGKHQREESRRKPPKS
jgi:hypothetical protein